MIRQEIKLPYLFHPGTVLFTVFLELQLRYNYNSFNLIVFTGSAD